MSGADHLGFIVAAYSVTTIVLLTTIAVLFIDNRAQKRLLAQLGSGGNEPRP